MKKYIGVFDSGKGGLSVLEEIRKLLPNYDYIYYGDSINNPYGGKSKEEIISIAHNIVEKLVDRGCVLIVIACNTATVSSIKALRKSFPNIIFIGTVPAVKVACVSGSVNTLVMATPATIESERTLELVSDFKREGQKIYLEACNDLAHSIEIDDYSKINDILNEIYKKYKDNKIDSIVLGCTHYSLIKDSIRKIFGDVSLIDGNSGVAREVKRQIDLNHLELSQNGSVLILNEL